MREIKFRAWDIMGGQMTYFKSLRDFCEFKAKFVNATHNLQYTGIKDKNGKEIYEGDIIGYGDEDVRSVVRFGEYCFNDDEYGVKGVGFYLEHFEYGKAVDMQSGGYSSPASTNMVIGNLYENPGLLTPKL